MQEKARLQQKLRGAGPADSRRVEEQLQEVERRIQGMKEIHEMSQSGIQGHEKAIQQVLQEQDEGVWRVWSASHC